MNGDKPVLLYVMHCFFNRAGTEEHTRALIAGLRSEFDIYVIAPKDSVIQVIRDGAAVQSIPAPQVAWPITPYRSAPHEEILSKLIAEISPDLIHLQHFYNWPL